MRHRVKTGMVGSFAPEKQKVEIEQLRNREVTEWGEESFEVNSEFNNDDEALAAMDFHDSQTYWNNGLVTSYPHYSLLTALHVSMAGVWVEGG